MMRVLYVCRAFAGIRSSLQQNRWEPTGVPTIYKIIEALDSCSDLFRLMITIRDEEVSFSHETLHSYSEVEVSGLKAPIVVSSNPYFIPKILRRFQAMLVEIIHVVRVMREVRKIKPDLVYVDRANVIPGAFVARFTKVPVLLRVMGIYPSMWEIVKSYHPWLFAMRWAFRSPFTQVLCTQDGTPGEAFMKVAVNPEVPRQMMLNGVDKQSVSYALAPNLAGMPLGKFIVLFVGRLVENKGPEAFVEAVLRLFPHCADRIHALIIGTGVLESQLRSRVTEAGAEDMITFVSRVPHRQIRAVHRLSDIYVSLNRLGNLSNANLECMYDGMCMIVPPGRPEEGADIDLDRLMPSDTIIRLSPMADEVAQLATVIEQLSRNPRQVRERGRRTAETAGTILWSWEERIAAEMDLLRSLVGMQCIDPPTKSKITTISENALR